MRLSKNEIKYLSSSFHNPTILSLFKNIEAQTDGSEYQSLSDKGIIVNNEYESEALDILMLLSNAEKSSRIVIQTPFFIVEKYTYRVGDKLVLAENHDGNLEFSYVDDSFKLSVKLSEIYGISKISNVNINEVFSPEEIAVLFALTDLHRIVALKNYSGNETKKAAFSMDEIMEQLNSGYKNGFVKLFTKNYNYEISEDIKISGILDSLANKGVAVNENGYSLTKEYLKFAENFLIIDSISIYEAYEIQKDPEVAVAVKLAVLSGLHDIATISFDGEMVKFETVSAKQLLFDIENFMLCPEFEKHSEYIQDMVSAETELDDTKHSRFIPESEDWSCPNCKKNNNGKFCTGCGTSKTQINNK